MWVVTGVAGFIGSNLMEDLLALGQTVVGVDNFSTGHRSNIDEVLSGPLESSAHFRMVEGDIRDLETCRTACEGADYVLHHAALGSVPWSMDDPLRTNAVNVDGFINSAFGLVQSHHIIDWLGDPRINLLSAVIAASWRHVGYILVIYLAGLKSVDVALREAAKVDGANEWQTFFRVVFPVMAPINVVIAVITAIEALRAFDIAYIINRGKNGLELLSTLITNNSISEASLVGFGSAIAVVLLVISLGPIVLYLSRVGREAA